MTLARFSVRRLMGFVAIAALMLGPGRQIGPSLLNPGTNCGGNTAALWNARTFAVLVRSAADEDVNHEFNMAGASTALRGELADIAENHWIRPARFLVAPMPYRNLTSGPRRPLIVCDTPFRNVPRPLFPRFATPRYAVGYSDGTAHLLTAEECRALDLSQFRPLDELLATSPGR